MIRLNMSINTKDPQFLLKDKYNLPWSSDLDKIIRSKPDKSEVVSKLAERFPDHFNDNNISDLKKDLSLLETDYPLAYIIGYTDFLGCKIDLQYKPLIPRPETEYWVENAIKIIIKNNISKTLSILDLFCGSGCIGISVLKHIENSRVIFADIEREFLTQTNLNLDLNDIESQRYNLIRSDIFNNLQGLIFDVILANPPYIDIKAEGSYDKSLKHEPSIALFSQNSGLDNISKFLESVKNYLNPGGIVFMEFGKDQKEAIEKFNILKDFERVNFYRDQFDRFRYLSITI